MKDSDPFKSRFDSLTEIGAAVRGDSDMLDPNAWRRVVIGASIVGQDAPPSEYKMTVVAGIKSWFKKIGKAFKNAIKEVGKFFKNVGKWFEKVWNKYLKPALKVLKKIVTSKIFAAISGVIAGAFTFGVAAGAIGAAYAAISAAVAIVQKVVDVIDDAVDVVEEAVEIAQTVQEAAGEVKSTVDEVRETIKNFDGEAMIDAMLAETEALGFDIAAEELNPLSLEDVAVLEKKGDKARLKEVAAHKAKLNSLKEQRAAKHSEYMTAIFGRQMALLAATEPQLAKLPVTGLQFYARGDDPRVDPSLVVFAVCLQGCTIYENEPDKLSAAMESAGKWWAGENVTLDTKIYWDIMRPWFSSDAELREFVDGARDKEPPPKLQAVKSASGKVQPPRELIEQTKRTWATIAPAARTALLLDVKADYDYSAFCSAALPTADALNARMFGPDWFIYPESKKKDLLTARAATGAVAKPIFPPPKSYQLETAENIRKKWGPLPPGQKYNYLIRREKDGWDIPYFIDSIWGGNRSAEANNERTAARAYGAVWWLELHNDKAKALQLLADYNTAKALQSRVDVSQGYLDDDRDLENLTMLMDDSIKEFEADNLGSVYFDSYLVDTKGRFKRGNYRKKEGGSLFLVSSAGTIYDDVQASEAAA